MNPRCQKLSELDAKTAEMDKEWYTKRDSKKDEPAKIAKIYVTVYYAEKGEQKLHHFKKSMDIGNGHGGIVSQLKYNNEMKHKSFKTKKAGSHVVIRDLRLVMLILHRPYTQIIPSIRLIFSSYRLLLLYRFSICILPIMGINTCKVDY